MSTDPMRRSSLRHRFGVAAAALVLAFAGPALLSPATAGAAPVAPPDDPFYQPPADFADAAPGTILRSRPIQLGLALPVRSWQLLYRTTDLLDNPDVTVTTVILPDNVRADRPLLSYQYYEDASGLACVPSYTLQAGASSEVVSTAQFLLVLQQLQHGWVVSVPDFEGRFGHFAVAKESGYMSLDGIRAAQQFEPLGLGAHPRIGLYGYSGGGLATGWAAQMQPSYAPELDIAGVALSAPAPDRSAALLRANGGPFSGVAGAGLASLYYAYPEVNAALRPHLTAEGEAALRQIHSQCLSGYLIQNAGRNWQQYVDLSLDQLVALPPIKAIFDQATLGTPAPTAPLFAYQSLNDEEVPADATDRMIEKYCAAGTSVNYLHDQTAEHLTGGLAGWVSAFSWLQQRLDTDTPAPTGCETRTVLSGAFAPK